MKRVTTQAPCRRPIQAPSSSLVGSLDAKHSAVAVVHCQGAHLPEAGLHTARHCGTCKSSQIHAAGHCNAAYSRPTYSWKLPCSYIRYTHACMITKICTYSQAFSTYIRLR